MDNQEKKEFIKKYNDKKQKLKKKRKILRYLLAGSIICIALAVCSFKYAKHLNGSQKESFYVYYANCRVCKRDLPKLNKDNKYVNYEFTKDKVKIVNEIGFNNYEKITSHRVPVKITIVGDKIEYMDNPLK